MMKLRQLLFVGLLASAVSAQSPNTSAGVQILGVNLQRVMVKGPKMRAVPSTDPYSRARQRVDQGRDVDNAPALHRMSRDAEVASVSSKSDPLGNLSAPPKAVFVAALVIKNSGTKPITAVNWDYLMFELGGTEPVQKVQVRSKRTIEVGEQVELTKQVSPKGKEHQVVITRIEYADGSTWLRPVN